MTEEPDSNAPQERVPTESTPEEQVPAEPIDGVRLLDEVRAWLARFLRTVNKEDLHLLAVWIVHTHLVAELYTTPRLLIDSPVPGSGKTTALEHIAHLAHRPVQMATVSSSAMLPRMLDTEMRTILIDEADRALRPDGTGTPDILAVLNSGYKKGATRPVLVPHKEKGWVIHESPTHCPVAMAGNSPQLPEDTRTRTIRVLLLPDRDGSAEESDWELIEPQAQELAAKIRMWADQVRDQIAATRPPVPEGITGRMREKWLPLKRIATAAGGHWPDRIDRLALIDKEQVVADREDGMITAQPHVVLLEHLAEVWPDGEEFTSTSALIDELIGRHPETWGKHSTYGASLTARRLAMMLADNYKVNSKYRTSSHLGPKGYRARDLDAVMKAMGLALPLEDPEPTQALEPTQQNDHRDHRDPEEPGADPRQGSVIPEAGAEDRDALRLSNEGALQNQPELDWVEDNLNEDRYEDWRWPSEDCIREYYEDPEDELFPPETA